MSKVRLDVLVQKQAGVTRSQAQGLIRTGKVSTADGTLQEKPGQRVDEGLVVVIAEGPPFVSRGGQKLDAALEHFSIDVEGKVAIDVGASTGGFTDCLLQRHASKVYAVDVGYGQLDWKLRQDDRVVVLERTNIRHLGPDAFEERPTFFTADCSFISLRLVLPALKPLVEPDAEGVVLIKPQFEAGKEQVGKGGVVRDEAVHREVVEEVLRFAAQVGFESRGVIRSPLLGPAGNREFLAHLIVQS